MPGFIRQLIRDNNSLWSIEPRDEKHGQAAPVRCNGIRAYVPVIALAAVEVRIRSRTRAGELSTEGVELIRVGHRAGRVPQEPDVAVTIIP